jgi:hypothetical protein
MVRIRMTIPRGETQERRQLRRRGEHRGGEHHRRCQHRRGEHHRHREQNRYVPVLTAHAGGVAVLCHSPCAGGVTKESLLVGGVDVVRGLRVEVERVEVERVEVLCRFLVPCAGGVATEAVLVRGVPVLWRLLVPCAGGVATEAVLVRGVPVLP